MLYLVLASIFFAILFAFLAIFGSRIKGKVGENMVISHAHKYLSEEYIMLNNCTIKDENQQTTQIDHILLSPYGIFVIETKNYNGWIFGGERQRQWTQKIYKNSYKFQNPLHQNYRHVKVLEIILSDLIESTHIHSLVVFTPKSTFKTEMPVNVVQGKQWLNYVKQFNTPIIQNIRLKRIRYRLEKEILEPSWKTDREHIQQLAQHHEG